MPHTGPLQTATLTQNFDDAVVRVQRGSDAFDQAADLALLLTDEEKLWLLDGDSEFWAGMREMESVGYNTVPLVMGEIRRLGIPGFRFSDGPRGAVIGASTAFPVSMARGATWNLLLEERIGVAIGEEVRAQGGNFFGGVCINLPRHPAWGRAQETYSEDPVLLGEFGAALVRGIRRNTMAVAKHFALNSMENARFAVNVVADDQTLHEVYFPHFRRVVEEGADAIMMAYNSVNGEWAGQNRYLIQDVLRTQWNFSGVTVSDFIFGIRDASASLRAGLDVEQPFRQQRAGRLPADLAAGTASWSDVERAVLRILATQLRFHASLTSEKPPLSVVFSDEHRLLTRQAAAEAMVLLKNDAVDGSPVLPLLAQSLRSVALIGRLAALSNTGDNGSSDVRSPLVTTPLDGLRAALPDVAVRFEAGIDLTAVAEAAADADVAIVIAGYTAEDEGEYLGGESLDDPMLLALFPPSPSTQPGQAPHDAPHEYSANVMGHAPGGDRHSLRLRPADVEMITATVAANPRTIVVVVTAGAVIMEEWKRNVPTILIAWYSGSEGGAALADVLLGVVDAAGRLPYSIPTDESHLPHFDRNASEVVYDRWHGQRLLDRNGLAAAFPLGYGLSYTSFALGSLNLSPVQDESFTAAVTVTNTGLRPGRHVVQLYGRAIGASDFAVRVLLGFAPVWLQAGESTSVVVTGSTRPLQRWTPSGFVVAATTAVIEAAAYSGDPNALLERLVLSS
jgi:beta-glucosidase